MSLYIVTLTIQIEFDSKLTLKRQLLCKQAPGESESEEKQGKWAEEHETEEFGERSTRGSAGEPVDFVLKCSFALGD